MRATARALPEPPEPDRGQLRSMQAHRQYLLSCVNQLRPFRQHILDAVDLNICEDIVSSIDLPRFDNSAMDGYAVRAEDVAEASQDAPLSLPVVGEIAAGEAATHRLSPGTAMKIMTGAPVPPDADTIVPYENTDRGRRTSGLRAQRRRSAHPTDGEDIKRGRSSSGWAITSVPRHRGCLRASDWTRCRSDRDRGWW